MQKVPWDHGGRSDPPACLNLLATFIREGALTPPKKPACRCECPTLLLVIAASFFLWLAPVAAADERNGAAGESGDRGFAEFRLGFKAGISLAQHVGTEERGVDYRVSSSWRTGFAGGAFIVFPVTSRFALQQEILYVQKGSRQRIGLEVLDIPTVLNVTYDMDYIEIPVLVRFALMKWERSELLSTAGTVLALKVRDHYTLEGLVTDGTEEVPLHADSDMFEVDMFDFCITYGLGLEFPLIGRTALVEYRFTMGMNTLYMPTYAYVPFVDGEELIDNEPVPLKNQNHLIMLGVAF